MRKCKSRFRSTASKVIRAILSVHESLLKFGPIGIFIAQIVITRTYIERRQTCRRLTSTALAAERAFN
jgi:hypothetical protein